MANLTTISDVVQDVLFRAGQNPTDTSGDYYAKALQYANRTRLELLKGNGPLKPEANVAFKWAVKYPPANFIIQPYFNTLSVLVTTFN